MYLEFKHVYFTLAITRSHDVMGDKAQVEEPRGQWLKSQAEQAEYYTFCLSSATNGLDF